MEFAAGFISFVVWVILKLTLDFVSDCPEDLIFELRMMQFDGMIKEAKDCFEYIKW